MPEFKKNIFIAILRQNLSDVFSCSCLLECCLATISGHDPFFVCLFSLCFFFGCCCLLQKVPLFLIRSAYDKFDADDIIFNHCKQKKYQL